MGRRSSADHSRERAVAPICVRPCPVYERSVELCMLLVFNYIHTLNLILGSKTHQLVFCYMSGYEKFLDCYLNDWQHILMPFGLIPDMRVKVKNVLAQSRKYLKATIFTTFELIDYEPKMPFNTVNL